MRVIRIIIILAVFVVGCGYASIGYAQQHDHQDWNLMSIGRIVTLARTNHCMEEGASDFVCGVDASHEAIIKLNDVLSTFDCTSFAEDARPQVSRAVAFTRHDHGPVVVAEVENVSCRSLPSTQLMPVAPDEFKKYCSRLEWKCDAVWIPDSDPSVWYIGVIANIPRLHHQ